MNDKLLNHFNRVEQLHWWWEGRRTLIMNLLINDPPSKILDVGCGTGHTLTFLKSTFPKAKLYGVDLSKKAVFFSKKRGHKNIYQANALKLPFKKEQFDVVLLLDVLEHIKDHQKVINETKRVLKKGGRIIVTNPALNFIWSSFDDNQGHERRYTRRELRKLAKSANMNLELISYFNFVLSPPIIIIRLLGKLRPFRSFADYDTGINFDIAFNPIINKLLKEIFVIEINMLKYIRYPFGISIVAVYSKK